MKTPFIDRTALSGATLEATSAKEIITAKKMLKSNKVTLLDFTASQQFGGIDCVKQDHRGLQQTDTLNERNLQIVDNQQHKESVYERVRKEMKEERGSHMRAIEQDWLKKKQLAMKRKAHAEEVRQMMKEEEQRRIQKMERLKETQKLKQMQQRKMIQQELRKNQLQKQMEAVNSHLEHQELRGPMLTDTLTKRKGQVEHNQRHEESVSERVWKEMKEEQGSHMRAIEQDWLNKRQLAMKRKAHAEEVRQWMKEKEQRRMQKMERLKETQECEQMQQHEMIQEEHRQHQLQKQTEAVNSHVEHHEHRPLDNTASQQLYQNDDVKQRPRGQMPTDTLTERKVQIEHNQLHKDSAVEQARKDTVEQQGSQMRAIEPGRLTEEQRAMRRKAYAEELKQQMRENEQRRAQKKMERLKDIQESKQQYELDKEELRKKPLQKYVEAVDSYIENQKLKCRNTTLQDNQEEMKKGQVRNSAQEREQRAREYKEKLEEKIRQRIRRSEVLGAKLETQQREQAKRLEELHSMSAVKALAKQEAQYRQEQNCKKQKLLDMKRSIVEHTDDKRKEHQLQAMEEQRSCHATLLASQEADRLYREAQRLEDQRKRVNRSMIDAKLCEQIANKRAAEQLRKQMDTEFYRKISEIHALKDQQIERYIRHH